VSGTVHVHLFSGFLSHFSLFRAGGGGGRGRGGGGLLRRLARSAAKTFGEATGGGSAGRGRPTGGRTPDGAASFARFKASREDLFEDQGDELVDDQDVEDDAPVEGNGPGEGAGMPGPTYGAKDVCTTCQGVHGHHWHGCPSAARAGR
jgi:hypothetical protein